MARLTRLRPILVRVVLAQLSALGATSCCSEEPPLEADVSFDDPPAETAELLARCARDAGDCGPLCDAALKQVLGEDALMSGAFIVDCTLTVTAGQGTIVHLVYEDGSICGRAPVGLASSGRVETDDAVGAWLAEAAHLEAASVVAFVQLAVDLARLGAPTALVERALAAAREEATHARLVGELAHARGIAVKRVEHAPYRPLGLLELAIHNAREGCVREAVGAAINVWQARCAERAELRRVFARIADDEAGHAELAWQIDAWARSRLSAAEYREVTAARAAATEAMLALAADSTPEMRRVLGLPSEADVRQLTHAISTELACAA